MYKCMSFKTTKREKKNSFSLSPPHAKKEKLLSVLIYFVLNRRPLHSFFILVAIVKKKCRDNPKQQSAGGECANHLALCTPPPPFSLNTKW